MSLEVQRYRRATRAFETVEIVEVGHISKTIYAFRARGNREELFVECGQDDSEAIVYRYDPKSNEHEILKRLGQGESLGMAVSRSARSAEPTLHNIIHR